MRFKCTLQEYSVVRYDGVILQEIHRCSSVNTHTHACVYIYTSLVLDKGHAPLVFTDNDHRCATCSPVQWPITEERRPRGQPRVLSRRSSTSRPSSCAICARFDGACGYRTTLRCIPVDIHRISLDKKIIIKVKGDA